MKKRSKTNFEKKSYSKTFIFLAALLFTLGIFNLSSSNSDTIFNSPEENTCPNMRNFHEEFAGIGTSTGPDRSSEKAIQEAKANCDGVISLLVGWVTEWEGNEQERCQKAGTYDIRNKDCEFDAAESILIGTECAIKQCKEQTKEKTCWYDIDPLTGELIKRNCDGPGHGSDEKYDAWTCWTDTLSMSQDYTCDKNQVSQTPPGKK